MTGGFLLAFQMLVAGEGQPMPMLGRVPQVQLRAEAARASVSRTLERALERLRQPECRALLADFRDSSGATLDERLAAHGRTLEAHAASVIFRTGADEEPCGNPHVPAFTNPGSGVVRICEPQWLRRHFSGRGPWLETVLIHELLHTLGLGEDPPSSNFISGRVRSSCGL